MTESQVVSALGNAGLTDFSVYPIQDTELLPRELYPLAAVKSPEDWLINEHFNEVEDSLGEHDNNEFSSRTFAAIISHRSVFYYRRTLIKPDYGLVIADREKVGLAVTQPYSLCGRFAVQAGSFLNFVQTPTLISTVSGLNRPRRIFLNQVAERVNGQIDTA